MVHILEFATNHSITRRRLVFLCGPSRGDLVIRFLGEVDEVIWVYTDEVDRKALIEFAVAYGMVMYMVIYIYNRRSY